MGARPFFSKGMYMKLTESQWLNIQHGLKDCYFDNCGAQDYDNKVAKYMADYYFLDQNFQPDCFEGQPLYPGPEHKKRLKRCFKRLLSRYIDLAFEDELDGDDYDDCVEAVRSLCYLLGIEKSLGVDA